MTTTAEPTRGKHRNDEIPPWMRKTRRILDILATGGTIWLTEPKPAKKTGDERG